MELIVAVANDGVAGIPGSLRLTVQSADGTFRQSGTLDRGCPHAGKVRQASILLPSEIGDAELKLSVEIETKADVRRSIQWSCAQHLNPDGSFPVRLKSANAEGWRKGI